MSALKKGGLEPPYELCMIPFFFRLVIRASEFDLKMNRPYFSCQIRVISPREACLSTHLNKPFHLVMSLLFQLEDSSDIEHQIRHCLFLKYLLFFKKLYWMSNICQASSGTKLVWWNLFIRMSWKLKNLYLLSLRIPGRHPAVLTLITTIIF